MTLPTWARRLACIVTILAIAGTLSACGRYGSPVRVVPVPEPIDAGTPTLEGPDEVADDESEAADDRTSESK